MKLTAGEIRALLPLLRPNVRIEIVLHDDEPVAEDKPSPVPRAKKHGGHAVYWTPERRAAHAAKIRANHQRKREDIEAAMETREQNKPVEPEPIKEVHVKAFAISGTPDQRQAEMLRAEVARMRAAKSGGV